MFQPSSCITMPRVIRAASETYMAACTTTTSR